MVVEWLCVNEGRGRYSGELGWNSTVKSRWSKLLQAAFVYNGSVVARLAV